MAFIAFPPPGRSNTPLLCSVSSPFSEQPVRAMLWETVKACRTQVDIEVDWVLYLARFYFIAEKNKRQKPARLKRSLVMLI